MLPVHVGLIYTPSDCGLPSGIVVVVSLIL